MGREYDFAVQITKENLAFWIYCFIPSFVFSNARNMDFIVFSLTLTLTALHVHINIILICLCLCLQSSLFQILRTPCAPVLFQIAAMEVMSIMASSNVRTLASMYIVSLLLSCLSRLLIVTFQLTRSGFKSL